ncbi:unnamed protein product [Amoebophrya sp. A120]|nr:unnamed protein product [Amoebophrya sp. A120]|eukprot:GSA120T00007620001.1
MFGNNFGGGSSMFQSNPFGVQPAPGTTTSNPAGSAAAATSSSPSAKRQKLDTSSVAAAAPALLPPIPKEQAAPQHVDANQLAVLEDKNDPLGPLQPGQSTSVQGSGTSVYTIERKGGATIEAGAYYQCSCPAFKFSNKANKGKPWAARTCKHLQKLRGMDREEQRIRDWMALHGAGGAKVSGGAGEDGLGEKAVKPAKAKAKAKAGAAAAKKRARKSDDQVVDEAADNKDGEEEEGAVALLLAQTWNPATHDVTNYWASEKLDGVRAYWDNEQQKFFSRAGNVFHAPKFFTDALPKSHKLDGELFLGRKKFQECVSTVRKHVPLDHEWRRMKYMVFDVVDESLRFEERMALAKKLLAAQNSTSNNPSYAVFHEHTQLKLSGATTNPPGEQLQPPTSKSPSSSSKTTTTTATAAAGAKSSKTNNPPNNPLKDKVNEIVFAMLKKVEQDGGEGLMLREPNSLYERKRSNTLLKVKTFFDLDATVVRIEQGAGKHKNRMGALVCKDAMNRSIEFKVGTGFTDEMRENPPPVGSLITVKYQEKTKDGKPRFPVFMRVRTDK